MTDTEPARTRPFADVLRDLSKGQLHDELSTLLQDLIGAVQDTGKAGKLVLTLTVKPLPKTDGMVAVADSVTVKSPELDRNETYYFVDDDLNLTREHPRQQALPLRDVSTPPARHEGQEAQ